MLRIALKNAKHVHRLTFSSPKICIALKLSEIEDSDHFYAEVVKEYYDFVTSRHPKFPIFSRLTRGVGVCNLLQSFDEYFSNIEASARRNVRKAIKNGYSFRRIEFNEHIEDVWDIRRSTEVRQGPMDTDFINSRPKPVINPPSRAGLHDYPYFGVFDKNGTLRAYAGCLVAGEVIELSHFYGHAKHQSNAVVPLLITSIAGYAIDHYPRARFFVYGGHLGASATLQRFKRKFSFQPHTVTWRLD